MRRKKQKNVRAIALYLGAVVLMISLTLIIIWSYKNIHIEKNEDKKAEESQEAQIETFKEIEDVSIIEEAIDKKDENESKEMMGTAEASQRELEKVQEIISAMTLEEKVAQLFIIRPEALTGDGTVIQAGEKTKASIMTYPVGGVVYFKQNINSSEQIQSMLTNTQQYGTERMGIPMFLSVDEEGGMVSRISGRGFSGIPDIPAMMEIGNSEVVTNAYETGSTIGAYLKELGFNLDFAPVADVASNPNNTVIGSRAFSTDAAIAAQMVAEYVKGMQGQNILTTLKHFPGHGDTAQDSHYSSAVSYKTKEELQQCEFLPFVSGIDAGATFVMVGHVALPNVTGDNLPATLSGSIVMSILREELKFDGIIITDAMDMGAIVNHYSSSEAAVRAIQAGIDVILMPKNFQEAYTGVIQAVKEGTITEERIEESLKRILKVKLDL